MRSSMFWTVLACVGAQRSCGLSNQALDLLSIVNGYWDNTQQIQEGGQGHDFVQAWLTPVDVPALAPNPVLAVKELVNGNLLIFNLAEIVGGEENNTMILKVYNFTDISQDEAKEYDLEKLKTIRREDLQSSDDCFAVYSILERDLIVANYPYCKYTINGKHPLIGITYTCDLFTVTFPPETDQASPVSVYIMRQVGPRYPLINPPNDYVSPCGN